MDTLSSGPHYKSLSGDPSWLHPTTKTVLQDNKVPGSSTGTRVAAVPGLTPTGSAAGFLGESWAKGSHPCQTRFGQHWERPGCLKSQARNKDKSGKHTGTVCTH